MKNQDINSRRLVSDCETTESETLGGCVRWNVVRINRKTIYQSGLVIGGKI